KKILKERIFYPGYVMIEVVLNEEVKNFFQKINYVVGFLGKPNSIIPLTDKEITRFFNKVNIISDKSISLNKYYMGESIKIIDGPFNGFNGVIEDINEEKKRLKIIVKIFGRRTPVELNYFQVER
ncbi:MAG: KOW motif-containing protein, partial [Bacteroides sp.]